jgi:WD40 repeat protein
LWDLNEIDSSQTPRILENSEESAALSLDSHWLVTVGNGKRQDLQSKINDIDKAIGSGKGDPNERLGLRREQQGLHQKMAQLVPVTTLLDLTAKDPFSSARILNNGGKVLDFSHDGHWLLSAGTDGVARLWTLAGPDVGAKPIELHGHDKAVETAAFSHDKRWLVTGSSDNTVRLWSLNVEDISASSRELMRYKFGVDTVTFSRDKQWLLTAGSNDIAHLWNLGEDGSPARHIALPVSGNAVSGGVFTDDGRWLMTRSYTDNTNTISVWALKSDALIEIACRAAGRSLTQDEWQLFFAGRPNRQLCPGLDGRGEAGAAH